MCVCVCVCVGVCMCVCVCTDDDVVKLHGSLSPSDDLSQDPTPSSTCASPELPPHVPMEKEKTGDGMDAEEECSGMFMPVQCMHTILTKKYICDECSTTTTMQHPCQKGR